MYNSHMKNIIMTISTLVLFSACSKVDGLNPSQNVALNTLAGKKEKEKSGFMQQRLDKWLNEEWSPVTEGAKVPTGETKIKIIENQNGTAKLVESETGTVLKEISKEELKVQKEIHGKYQDKDRSFTLQEYIDKMAVYNGMHISDEKNSHVKKIDAMPVIGTIKR